MPPTNTKKRSAPGSSPAMQAAQMPQSYVAPSHQVSNQDYPRYNQNADNQVYQDPSAYNMNPYGGNGIPQGQYELQNPPQPNQLQSTQLARRPLNRQQLVPTGQRYDNTVDTWLGDDPMQDPQQGNGMEESDNIELLEEKAAVAKREAQAKRKQIPPFVQKLSSFLDGAKNTELIRWSDRGDSFVVLDEDEFAKTLIPELFKHNNYASFVRQLNMYGFHKRVGLSDNSMKASERKNKSPSEYYNPYFKRGHPNLLWLINKPKGGGKAKPPGQGSGAPRGIVKPDPDVDSDEEGQTAIEEIYREHLPSSSRAISQAPEGGQLQKRELAVVQHQLADIQKQQAQITNTLTRLRKDHNTLFQQSMNFQGLHDRHENSINAILTFLATVYNRSLDGNSPQNFAQMFANGIPHEQHTQGNVVEIREPANPSQNPGNTSPQRRQPRLLMAPPANGSRAETLSPASTPRGQHAFPPKSAAVEEIFDSPPDTSDIKPDPDSQQQQPDIMMNIINSTNAQNSPNVNAMEFPQLLQHYENANGQSPLTPDQRNTMLNLIATSSSAPGTNNALVSPTPPPPSLSNLEYTSADIERLLQANTATGEQINNIENIINQPLNSTSDMPILDDNHFFDGMESNDGLNGNLDMDQFLDDGAFYGDGSPTTNGNFDYGQYSNGSVGMGDSHFDIGMDGTNDVGRIIETAHSSEAATPENGLDESLGGGMRSPNKKRRRK